MATEYPEHEKLKALGGANQIVGDFIGWLDENGYEIGCRDSKYDHLEWCGKSRDELIAAHFEIDRNKLEDEKRAMLASIRAKQVQS